MHARGLALSVLLALWTPYGATQTSLDIGANRHAAAELGDGAFRTEMTFRATGQARSDLDLSQAARRLTAVGPDTRLRARGARETSIYSKAASSVVLIVTNAGLGSGSLISADGQILTNWHVVSGQRDIGVIFKPVIEGKEVTRKDIRVARLVKYDEIADLALLRVSQIPSSAGPILLGSMSEIQVGSDVHAIGHPTGENWTYTKGLVSQLRKNYQWATGTPIKHRADVIQTQTPINPGNSGGPLISDGGRLVGVNSFKAEGEALNFAIAVTEVTRFLAQNGNRVARVEPSAKPSAACEVREIKRGRNKANDANLIWYDANCDGEWDAFIVVPDDQSKPIRLNIDSHDNGKIDITVLDTNRDGKWDISYHDVDGDGKPDLIGYHPDGEIKPSRFEPYVASR